MVNLQEIHASLTDIVGDPSSVIVDHSIMIVSGSILGHCIRGEDLEGIEIHRIHTKFVRDLLEDNDNILFPARIIRILSEAKDEVVRSSDSYQGREVVEAKRLLGEIAGYLTEITRSLALKYRHNEIPDPIFKPLDHLIRETDEAHNIDAPITAVGVVVNAVYQLIRTLGGKVKIVTNNNYVPPLLLRTLETIAKGSKSEGSPVFVNLKLVENSYTLELGKRNGDKTIRPNSSLRVYSSIPNRGGAYSQIQLDNPIEWSPSKEHAELLRQLTVDALKALVPKSDKVAEEDFYSRR